ncbi:MAG: YggS family pyridoxal phosphate-dependent enzyme [Bacteroidota bacterium]|nr:YggS family pyridoxal phosphate-dependent enzyme [Bacteroidota bacterium]
MTVKEHLLQIKKDLPPQVTLIAVSKTKPNELIMEAYEADQKDFGENYVQELVEKHEQLPKDIRWHFIGHLQSNKVKNIAPFVHMIHGVDSFKLLKEINKEAKNNNRTINCLLQLFIANEETKFGLSFKEADDILKSEELKTLKNISFKGFMAMASNTDSDEQIRLEFRSVKTFANKYPHLSVLSYGMSSDLKIAVEEGSTMVRVGSTIFGERNYTT